MVSHVIWAVKDLMVTYNPRREDLCCNDIASHAMAKGPPKGVEVDRHNTYNASRRDSTIVSCRLASESDVEGKIQHAGSLDARTDEERESSTYAIDKVSDIVDGCDELDETVDAGGEQTLAVSDADRLEDPWGEVVQGVGSSQFMEEEEHHG